MKIILFSPEHAQGWVRCRVLSFLDTPYFDDVVRVKPAYENPSVELVALHADGSVIGLIDIEVDPTLHSGMIHHFAVHPDFQGIGVGRALQREAEARVVKLGARRLEAWTRDDSKTREWYFKQGFTQFKSYLHVFMDGQDLSAKTPTPGLSMISGFSHYVGKETDEVRRLHQRVHECVGLEKKLT